VSSKNKIYLRFNLYCWSLSCRVALSYRDARYPFTYITQIKIAQLVNKMSWQHASGNLSSSCNNVDSLSSYYRIITQNDNKFLEQLLTRSLRQRLVGSCQQADAGVILIPDKN
jgi:hypothetical protein